MDVVADVETAECKEEARRIGVRHPLPFSGEYSWWIPVAFASKLERERDEAINAIIAFCEASQWCAKVWKEQDHIKPLFDIHDRATAAKGEVQP